MQKPNFIPLLLLLALGLLATFMPALPTTIVTEGINTGDTAWMLCATALVLLMTPGLAFFYGGMVNSKNVISTMLQSFVAMGIISLLWVVVGFSLAFGTSLGGFVGDPRTFFLFKGVLDGKPWSLAPTIPLMLFAFFQMKFAIITPALITGSIAERINFKSYIVFIVLFSLVVYAPLAHWVWHPEGFLFKLGVLDFAGGTVVHMSAGWAALASALYLKPRKAYGSSEVVAPANIPFVLLGTGLLWFGWFGFNAGSATAANALAVSAFATTNVAASAAGLAWILFDVARGKKLSAVGFCIGAVVGLVAITPASGFVTVPVSIFVGVIAGITSNFFAHIRSKSRLDDTLDVFPCHGIGGMVGLIMTGIFASKAVNSAAVDGLAYGGTTLFLKHMLALVLVSAFAFGASFVLLKITDLITPLRVSEEEELQGLDISQHEEKLLVGA
ncbi:ammonium transporter [Hymenobacter sp. BT770]|uniref:ammonium transporter n=1 Tax=Hymenobacter sp. BT770 TaxID=2886942 RepID=UPI001D119B1C|nr:ammonium transporter [Hymenobacter sp. BT770]MCC3154919.1 ammonium transporter [Hymenobacter sp. BT770]MDO3417331.1 ammonium transporter [Hymenobacter sp. BT770]